MRKRRKLKIFKRKMKNFILKCSAMVIGTGTAMAACALDSENWEEFFAAFVVGFVWLYMFSYANDFFYQKGEKI